MITGNDAVQLCQPDIHQSPPLRRRGGRRAFMKKREDDVDGDDHYYLYFGNAEDEDEDEERNLIEETALSPLSRQRRKEIRKKQKGEMLYLTHDALHAPSMLYQESRIKASTELAAALVDPTPADSADDTDEKLGSLSPPLFCPSFLPLLLHQVCGPPKACNTHCSVRQNLLAARRQNQNRDVLNNEEDDDDATGISDTVTDETSTQITLLHSAISDGHLDCMLRVVADQVKIETFYEVTQLRRQIVNRPDPSDSGSTPLYIAARSGHTQCIEALFKLGADVSQGKDNGAAPLHVASLQGSVDCVELILQYGANPNAVISSGENSGATAVAVAAKYSRAECVDVLARHGALVGIPMKDGTTPLYLAAQSGSKDCVDTILRHSKEVDLKDETHAQNAKGWFATPISIAAYHGHFECLKSLLNAGFDVNFAVDDAAIPLYIATQRRHGACVELLAQRGANPNAVVERGWTPLSIASYLGDAICVDILARHNADVNAVMDNPQRHSPLLIAAHNGHVSVVEVLVRRGAELNTTASDGATAVYVAAQQGQLECLKALVQLGADCDVQNSHGATPLYIAVQNNHVGAVKLLIELGANVNIPKTNGVTPLHMAAYQGHTECLVALACSGKACIDADASVDGTPLIAAVQQGHLDCLNVLVELGADINYRTRRTGCSALSIARANRHNECEARLLALGALPDPPKTPMNSSVVSLSAPTVASNSATTAAENTDGVAPNAKRPSKRRRTRRNQNAHKNVSTGEVEQEVPECQPLPKGTALRDDAQSKPKTRRRGRTGFNQNHHQRCAAKPATGENAATTEKSSMEGSPNDNTGHTNRSNNSNSSASQTHTGKKRNRRLRKKKNSNPVEE